MKPIRFAITAVTGAALLAALTACGSDNGSDDGSGNGSGNGSNDPDSQTVSLDEPVEIEHRFGTTEIDEVPQRVVTLDVQWTDVMLAMGVEPVGATADSRMPESGPPWQDISSSPEALSIADGLPFEQIDALDPDLILGTYPIGDAETYQLLSGIAPTVASLDERQITPWQDLVRTAGAMLADSGGAEEIIESVDADVAAVAEELPGLEGRTFTLAQYVVGDSIYAVADKEDGSSIFFQQLGMAMFPPVADEGEQTGEARPSISPERSDLLQADLLAFLVNGGDESDLADIPGFEQLPGTVAVLDYPTIVGLNTPSPLSIPYALEQLRPYLEDAAGDTTS